MNKRRDIHVRNVPLPAARTFGEAMRAIDEMHVLTGEFILIRADVVTNLDLQTVLRDFRLRKENDTAIAKTVMMMVLKRGLPGHAARYDNKSSEIAAA
jgi:NDP-sugar pyrophosphorylase family protein